MAQEAGLIYNISPNGTAGDWYWDVRCDGSIVARGLASTRADARGRHNVCSRQSLARSY
jgi:hypothetical protein